MVCWREHFYMCDKGEFFHVRNRTTWYGTETVELPMKVKELARNELFAFSCLLLAAYIISYRIKLALLLSCYMMEGMVKMKSYVCSPVRKDKSV